MPATPRPASDEPSAAPDQDVPAAAQEDVKTKFRQALERKNAKRSGGEGADGKDASKVHGGAHGPAHQQRTFRRKSG